MKVSPRTAALVIALALLGASVVGGREARPPAPPPPPPPVPEPRAREAPPPELELEQLARPGLGEPLANLFATPRGASAPRAARPAPAPPPPAPVAPPLPFRYLGKFVDGERNAVYLARGDEPFLAVPGAALGAEYRVEDVSPGAVTLVYVPLGTRQRLPVPAHD
jgi:hypothetical protein